MSSSPTPSYHDVEVTFSAAKASTPSKAIVHYVQAGDQGRPTVLLLHGFPASSHQYRDLIPMLSDRYHVLAPDFPGFGLTKVPSDFVFNFENLTLVMAAWLQQMHVTEAAIYIHDYGAPVGLRLAITNAIKPTAIISQNGNAYREGLGQDAWAPVMALWDTGSAEARKVVRDNMLSLEGTREQLVMGTPDKDLHLIDPQSWTLAYLQNVAGPVNAARQLDLLYDYRTNVDLYPAFQRYIRDSKVPVLAVWGKGDPAFLPAGAKAFQTDSPDAAVHLIDAGHFALETARGEIAQIVRTFLSKALSNA